MPKSLVRTKKSDPDSNVKFAVQPYEKSKSPGEPTTWWCKWCDCTFGSKDLLRQHGVEAKACRGGQAG
jgi:hypothetical protein